MDDNEFSFIKNLIGDTHDEEAPAPVQEMPPSHTPRYSARHKKSFLSFLKKGPQKAARKRLPPQIVSIYFGVPGSGKPHTPHIWRVMISGAVFLSGRMFPLPAVISLTRKPILVHI